MAKSLLVLLLYNINKSVLTESLSHMGSVELSDWHRGLHKSLKKKKLSYTCQLLKS